MISPLLKQATKGEHIREVPQGEAGKKRLNINSGWQQTNQNGQRRHTVFMPTSKLEPMRH